MLCPFWTCLCCSPPRMSTVAFLFPVIAASAMAMEVFEEKAERMGLLPESSLLFLCVMDSADRERARCNLLHPSASSPSGNMSLLPLPCLFRASNMMKRPLLLQPSLNTRILDAPLRTLTHSGRPLMAKNSLICCTNQQKSVPLKTMENLLLELVSEM